MTTLKTSCSMSAQPGLYHLHYTLSLTGQQIEMVWETNSSYYACFWDESPNSGFDVFVYFRREAKPSKYVASQLDKTILIFFCRGVAAL
jgi:hypothetical protein